MEVEFQNLGRERSYNRFCELYSWSVERFAPAIEYRDRRTEKRLEKKNGLTGVKKSKGTQRHIMESGRIGDTRGVDMIASGQEGRNK